MFREFSSDSAVGYVILTADLFVFFVYAGQFKSCGRISVRFLWSVNYGSEAE